MRVKFSDKYEIKKTSHVHLQQKRNVTKKLKKGKLKNEIEKQNMWKKSQRNTDKKLEKFFIQKQ